MTELAGLAGRPTRRDELLEERDFLLRSIRDLDAEHAAGDLTADDYRTLRDDYVARAAAAIRALDDGAEPGPSRSVGQIGASDAPIWPTERGAQVGPRSEQGRESKRGRGLRPVAVALAVLVAAVGAGLAVASMAGERLPGEQATGSLPETPESLIVRAQQHAREGEILEAIKTYDRVRELDPDNPVAWAQRGWLVSRAGLADEALANIDRALAIDPRYVEAWFFKGMVLWRLKQDAEGAREAFEQALAHDPPAQLATFIRDEILTELPPPG